MNKNSYRSRSSVVTLYSNVSPTLNSGWMITSFAAHTKHTAIIEIVYRIVRFIDNIFRLLLLIRFRVGDLEEGLDGEIQDSVVPVDGGRGVHVYFEAFGWGDTVLG